jgi:Zn-dependent peptidase ImmA (M78 family)/DNA-binding XRE family transcriptional regulator
MSLASRLKVARHRRAWSIADLARRSGVSERSVGDFERGVRVPEMNTLVDLAHALEFPFDFFRGDDLPDPRPASASFRAMSRLSAGHRNAAMASVALAIEFARWLERRYELPAVALEDYSGMDPETCADMFRRTLGLGVRPIRNMVHIIEKQGGRVFSLAEDCRELDAISIWWDGMPLVLLNTQKSAERSRFDAAHELGHLLMHRHGHGACDEDALDEAAIEPRPGRATENEANAFASAFLMPRAGVLASIPRWPRLDDLIEAKRSWNVSLAAMVYRLHTLGALSDAHYRQMCIEMQRRGYRTSEPQPTETRESSLVLAMAFGELRESGIDRDDVARMLRWPRRELEALVFGLAVSLVQGGGERTARPAAAHLRLVD